MRPFLVGNTLAPACHDAKAPIPPPGRPGCPSVANHSFRSDSEGEQRRRSPWGPDDALTRNSTAKTARVAIENFPSALTLPELLSSGDWSLAFAVTLLGGDDGGPRRGAVRVAQRSGPPVRRVDGWAHPTEPRVRPFRAQHAYVAARGTGSSVPLSLTIILACRDRRQAG
jgi:hypothetical protein